MPIEVDLTTEQQVKLTITPMTAAGNPAELEAVPDAPTANSHPPVPVDRSSVFPRFPRPRFTVTRIRIEAR